MLVEISTYYVKIVYVKKINVEKHLNKLLWVYWWSYTISDKQHQLIEC